MISKEITGPLIILAFPPIPKNKTIRHSGIPKINDFNPDIYLFSSYKTFGPHLGVMYVSNNLASELESQCHYFNKNIPNKRFTPAGPDHAQVSALGGIYDYFEAFCNYHLDDKLSLNSSIDGVNKLISSQEIRKVPCEIPPC